MNRPGWSVTMKENAMQFTARKPVIGALSALVCAALTAGSASAQDGKGYPGATCQTAATPADVELSTNGVVWNVSDDTQTWLCPAVQDIAGGSATVTGRVAVYDRHFSQAVCCTLAGRSKHAGAVETSTRCTVGSSPNAMDLNFDAAVDTAEHGYLNIHCTLPEVYDGWGSGIASFYLEED
jgi:hypothetical protein